MSGDFVWSEADEPHAARRRQMLLAHPEIRQLITPDPFGFFQIAAVVLFEVFTAIYLKDSCWLFIIFVSYFLGAFLNHNLLLAIHELSHNLVFTKTVHNKILGIFANLPIGFPMSVTFQRYHLDHHNYQGIPGLDVDIPTQLEARLVTRNTFCKAFWVMFQLFFFFLRPLIVNPKMPGRWEVLNLAMQLLFNIALVYNAGWKPLAYLLLATFLGGGLHPIAGRFISEHYIFRKDQETYSYYGPMNCITWNVGYHNEHHDFPRIPGNKLHLLRKIAPEFYNGLSYHTSYIQVIIAYIMNPTVGPFSRTIRKPEYNKICRVKAYNLKRKCD